MVFALGGQHALDELGKERFHVVVTDMRMPEIDGATVLHAANHRSPETLRILFTGYADDKVLALVRPVLHQLLDKPSREPRPTSIEAKIFRVDRRDTLGPRRRL
jgi:DNA-binding NtrC family response regulator